MSSPNLIEMDTPKELDTLKDRLYKSKCKRLDMIDALSDKVRAEFETRDLKAIPTPQLAKMLLSITEIAHKQQPVISLHYEEDFLNSSQVVF